jgi:hypothetical protein
MAGGKPLTGFLLALSHSRKLAKRFSDPEQRDAVLSEWGLDGNDLFTNGDPTLEDVQAAVAAEHDGGSDGPPVVVTWWVWF